MVVDRVQGVTYDELGEIELTERHRPPLSGVGSKREYRSGPAV